MNDPHETRMVIGQSAISLMEALDDDAIALFEPAAQAVQTLAEQLRSNGLSKSKILCALVAVCMRAAMDE